MRGLGTVLKSLDRSNNTVSFNLSFTLFRRILSTSTSPIAVLDLPCIAGIFCHMARFMQKDCECVRVAVLFQGDLKSVSLTLRNTK